MLRLPACYGSHNLGMVGYLQVPSNLLWNPHNVIFPMVRAPGTHTWPYDVFLDERWFKKDVTVRLLVQLWLGAFPVTIFGSLMLTLCPPPAK